MKESQFRILKFVDDEDEFVESWERYEKHLQQFDQSKCRHLWKYFKNNSFHDGSITNLKLSEDFCDLSFQVSCDDIRFKSDQLYERYGDCSMHFICEFHDICYLQIDTPQSNNGEFDFHGTFQKYFGYGEINTLTEKIAAGTEDSPLYSLIFSIESLRTYFSLVFEGLTVTAVERGALYMMKGSGDYIFPWLEDEEEKSVIQYKND